MIWSLSVCTLPLRAFLILPCSPHHLEDCRFTTLFLFIALGIFIFVMSLYVCHRQQAHKTNDCAIVKEVCRERLHL
jgi:hypothetical protein